MGKEGSHELSPAGRLSGPPHAGCRVESHWGLLKDGQLFRQHVLQGPMYHIQTRKQMTEITSKWKPMNGLYLRVRPKWHGHWFQGGYPLSLEETPPYTAPSGAEWWEMGRQRCQKYLVLIIGALPEFHGPKPTGLIVGQKIPGSRNNLKQRWSWRP